MSCCSWETLDYNIKESQVKISEAGNSKMTVKVMKIKKTILQSIIIAFFFCISKVFATRDKLTNEITACQDVHMLLGSTKNMAKVVEVTAGSSVYLCCHFCTENDNYQNKVWYYKERGSTKYLTETMRSDTPTYRISMTSDHTLKLKYFNQNDSGVYVCKPIMRAEENVFTYVLEGVFVKTKKPIRGALKEWRNYKRNVINPINEKFIKSDEEPFIEFRNNFNFSFRIVTSWERWGPCKQISQRRAGIRIKLGKCILHPTPQAFSKRIDKNFSQDFIDNVNAYFIGDNYDVPCQSIKLADTLPRISEIVRHIPNFEVSESCDCTGFQVVKIEYKYNTIKQVAENGHLTVTCPEATSESNIEWYKDMNILNNTFRNNMAQSEEEPHITIDSYNSLYILHATKNEEGAYSCTVDGKKMQIFNVQVVAKSKLLNDDFFRYSIYLGFVLSLTMTCYCAGVFVAWHRRTSFADPLNLNANH